MGTVSGRGGGGGGAGGGVRLGGSVWGVAVAYRLGRECPSSIYRESLLGDAQRAEASAVQRSERDLERALAEARPWVLRLPQHLRREEAIEGDRRCDLVRSRARDLMISRGVCGRASGLKKWTGMCDLYFVLVY